jgi:hypothetical protein
MPIDLDNTPVQPSDAQRGAGSLQPVARHPRRGTYPPVPPPQVRDRPLRANFRRISRISRRLSTNFQTEFPDTQLFSNFQTPSFLASFFAHEKSSSGLHPR